MPVRVEFDNEVGTSIKPAQIRIYDDDKIVKVFNAIIQQEKGADGGYYDCVKFIPQSTNQ